MRPAVNPLDDAALDERTRKRDLITGGIALLLAVFSHASLLWVAPEDFFGVGRLLEAREPGERQIAIAFEPPPERDPADQSYVETNPDRPSHRPDDTANISDRDQQSAQETDEGLRDPENRPRVEGEMPDSARVVTGDLTDEPPPLTPPPGAESATEAEAQPTPPQIAGAPPPAPSAPEFLAPNPEVQEGLGSYLRPDPTPVEDPARAREIPAVLNPELASPEAATAEAGAQQLPPGQDRNTPMPRPRLLPQVTAGPLMQNIFRADEVGAMGIDAYHSDMGEYLNEVFEHIYRQWISSIRETFRTSSAGTGSVRVEFWISAEGEVLEATVLNTSAPRVNTLLARDAVLARAPYRAWTRDMRNTLGDRQSVTVTFIYR